MTMAIDPSWLNDSVKIKRKTGMDRYQKPTYEETTFDKVRVHMETVYSGTANNRQIVANGKVFLYADYTTPYFRLDKTWLDSIVTINDDPTEYVLTRVSAGKDIDTGHVWSYTLEVL